MDRSSIRHCVRMDRKLADLIIGEAQYRGSYKIGCELYVSEGVVEEWLHGGAAKVALGPALLASYALADAAEMPLPQYYTLFGGTKC